MRSFLRSRLRTILRFLTRRVLQKHQPTIIAIVGSGETSIARELITQVINVAHPVRRNLETPEAEFSVPLTVFAFKRYPHSYLMWLWVITKVMLQMILLRSFKHFLVLELDTVNQEIQDYWMKTLKPDLVVITGSDQKLVLSTREIKVSRGSDLLTNYKEIAKQVGLYYGIDTEISDVVLEDIDLPKARINFMPGINNITIVDATHYFYPISIKSTMEFVDPSSENVVVITDDRDDVIYLRRNFKPSDLTINPEKYVPISGDIVVLRGLRTKVLREYRYLIK